MGRRRRLQRTHAIVRVRRAREHHDRDVLPARPPPQLGEDLVALQSRETQIEEDEARDRAGLRRRPGVGSIGVRQQRLPARDRDDVVPHPRPAQPVGDQLRVLRVVVDDEHHDRLE